MAKVLGGMKLHSNKQQVDIIIFFLPFCLVLKDFCTKLLPYYNLLMRLYEKLSIVMLIV